MSESPEHAYLKMAAAHWLRDKCFAISTEVRLRCEADTYRVIDVLGVTARDLVYGIEAKAERGDFLSEHREGKTYQRKRGFYYGHTWLETVQDRSGKFRSLIARPTDWPHFMYIASPRHLISPEEVPEGWGLLWVDTTRQKDPLRACVTCKKRPRRNHGASAEMVQDALRGIVSRLTNDWWRGLRREEVPE